MTDAYLRPRSLKSTFLNINSANDVHAENKEHNPADFVVSMPNSVGSTNAWRVVAHTVSIPNVFPNVYAPFNEMALWERKLEVDDLGSNVWLIRGSYGWHKTSIVIPEGFYTPATLMGALNMSPLGERYVVEYAEGPPDSADRYMQIRAKPRAEPWYIGQYTFPPAPPEPPEYCGVGFLSELPGSHLFDILGFGSMQITDEERGALSPKFIKTAPGTMDNITGAPFADLLQVIPLFDISAHDSYTWQGFPVTRVATNPINLSKPVEVDVVIDQLGDNSTTDAETGLASSVIARVFMDNVERGKYATRTIHDTEAEAIQFRASRTIRSFSVKLKDTRGVQLRLPRNWPMFCRLQLLAEE